MKTNVLIFPAGEINSVELHDALSHNVNIEVFGASSVDRHGKYVFKNYRGSLPYITDSQFVNKFNALLKEWHIDFIFPTHDTIALFLQKHQNEIFAKIIGGDLKTAEICRYKDRTYKLFENENFCPYIYNKLDTFPCFLKPVDGQGGQNTFLVNSKADVKDDIDLSKYVICEYLPGEEMTVDCLTDAKGNLCAVLPRERQRMMAGVCVAGTALIANDEIRYIAERINSKLHFCGLWFFQIKKAEDGQFKLLEISARCAGTMCLSRARGVNLPLLSVYAVQGKNISVFENLYSVTMDRTLISRYKIDYEYERVYIDYDDTVVEKEKVCLPVIKFLYQCKNKGIEVVLLTRHEEDHDDSIEESLATHFIDKCLFNKIIKLTFADKKSDYIEGKSIFIDNAYAERKEVHEKKGIPVFDVEGIEVLEDWCV